MPEFSLFGMQSFAWIARSSAAVAVMNALLCKSRLTRKPGSDARG